MPLQDLMNSTADIQRPTVTSSEYMTQKQAWNAVASSCPCRVDPYDARKYNKFDMKIGEVTHKVFFCPIQDVKVSDRIVVKSGNYGVGEIYEVIESFVPDHVGMYSVSYVKRIKATTGNTGTN